MIQCSSYVLNHSLHFFVIFSSDRLRACVSKEELAQLLGHADIQGRKTPILFYANKMDVPGAMTPEMVAEELELEKVRDKQIFCGRLVLSGSVAFKYIMLELVRRRSRLQGFSFD